MLEVIADALNDSLKIFGLIFIIYVLIEFIEEFISEKLSKANKLGPVLGGAIGLIPQCGFSVVAADLYSKKQISMGTILAIFIATSDEAIPIIFSYPNKILALLPLILIKFVVACAIGYLVDFVNKKQKISFACNLEDEDHIGCCGHHIEGHESNVDKFLFHPLMHSYKIFLYILGANLIFGTIVHFVGEDNLANFLANFKYLSPLFAVLIGLIPNCASSVILSELFVLGRIGFGACLGGLVCNAGLGLLFLYKQNKNAKQNLAITGILISTAIIVGYAVSLILWFV